MHKVHFSLSLGQVRKVRMNNWVGIKEGKVRWNAVCVGMSERI